KDSIISPPKDRRNPCQRPSLFFHPSARWRQGPLHPAQGNVTVFANNVDRRKGIRHTTRALRAGRQSSPGAREASPVTILEIPYAYRATLVPSGHRIPHDFDILDTV